MGERGAPVSLLCVNFTLTARGRYLGGVVGDALEDPVHGRRVEGQVRRQLHALQHQLVLDCIPMNLQETQETLRNGKE